MNAYARRLCTAGAVVTLSLAAMDGFAQEVPGGVMETSHLLLRYDSDTENDARLVMGILQSEYELLSELLGFSPARKIEAHLFRGAGPFVAEAGPGNERKLALYARSVLLIRPLRGISEEKLHTSLAYEMSMIFLAEPLARSCPLWLAQSFALYHAGVDNDCSAPIETQIASFADLSQEVEQRRTPTEREHVECLLAKTMQFFIDRYGQEKIFSVFAAFDGRTEAEELLPKVVGEKYGTIEKEWLRAVRRRPELPVRR